ncbi:hypothetical protein [Levilactobacillus yonginensis]|uniref:hypothetical protein n=1 Tax=Levilactobacillus yonginensis TaxID=1054041 RepID=UPI00345D5D4D
MNQFHELMTIIAVLSGGVIGLSSLTSAQASTYSAKRSRSVKVVWRKSMKRHAFHGTTGYLYSQHLGDRYQALKTFPHTTWYTTKHEKLLVKQTHKTRIYYQVTSANGKHTGWVSRRYLKQGPVKRTKPARSQANAKQSFNAATVNQDFITQLNRARTAKGLSALQANQLIQTQVSNVRVTQITTNFSHYDRAGHVIQQGLFKNAGLEHASHGEVLDMNGVGKTNAATAKSIAYDYQHGNDQGAHWQLLMESQFIYYGIATKVTSNGTVYNVMNVMSQPF